MVGCRAEVLELAMSPGRLIYLVRRDLARGPKVAWFEHGVGRRIRRWRNPYAGGGVGEVPVHVLTGVEQFRMVLWMLASWFHFTGRNWQVVVHDDGTLGKHEEAELLTCVPQARLVWAKEADREVQSGLRDLPLCRCYRERHPLARKLVDVPWLSSAERLILLDADVLFFKRPVEILRWVDGASDGSSWFNEDFQEPSPVAPVEVEQALGFPLWPRVNSGVCLLDRATVDLKFCDEVMAKLDLLSRNLWRVEQFLLAVCASRVGKGGLLPSEYEVSRGARRDPEGISRHYVGAVRDRFYAEGVRELARVLL
ncbi:MAG: hypothetical protein SNJ84_09620 [Verrucomicrobiia bacterium]